MAKKIYVGGLPFSAEEEQLRTLFAEHGEVSSVSMITDRQTGQSKGFAFVEMPNDGEADKAIEMLNGAELGGRQIIVNVARPRETSGRGGGRY